jgi:5-oxoprolinase (ATP-hydrolysing)
VDTETSIDGWQFWIDRGGTFTDIVARSPDGQIVTHKLLSENQSQYPDAALHGIRRLLGIAADQPIPEHLIGGVKMGTTVGTNALLERAGEDTVLVTTRGFADALRIAYQNRPRLFDLKIVLPELLHRRVIEIDERIGAHGHVLRPLDIEGARKDLEATYQAGVRSAAIVFMHGYRFSAHEAEVAQIAREIGFTQISVSHQVSPLMKLVSRGDTTVVDAYLSPILHRYVDRVAAKLGDTQLLFMKSNGGLTDARLFKGKDSILSGPAGGVVGAARTAQVAGIEKIIGFDMGGTSTDVSRFDGTFERTFETQVAGVRMRAPMMHINTVAAGGGSILHFDGARYRVGPDSAGANPGPACYGNDGPLAVTDANVMVGKILPQHFPKVFGADADQPLDRTAVEAKFEALAVQIKAASGATRSPEEVADGYLQIAVENMANAIKKISIQRGYDVTRYTLQCFGGAGGQHAAKVADALGITQVLLHPLAGVLSALGMGLADLSATGAEAVEEVLDIAMLPNVNRAIERLAEAATAELVAQGVTAQDVAVQRHAHLRYAGTDTALIVSFSDADAMTKGFAAAHQQRFGFVDPGKDLIMEALSVEATGGGETIPSETRSKPPEVRPAPGALLGETRFFSGGTWHDATVVDRAHLVPGNFVDGPAILVEAHSTIVVEPGWRADVTNAQDVILRRVVALERTAAIGTQVDPVRLEIFNNLFMSVAEQMGSVLENTAHSVNIKERLDFSCALFDPDGHLIANAPHMPVHLGSMGESIQTIIQLRQGTMKPGDVYVLNAPYNGGTHLPDVTVITPVFDTDARDKVLFYVGSRGHHADLGGITPGSMPPDSTSVDQEGILFDNFHLVDEGRFQEQAVLDLLASGPNPARNPQQNIADLKAQIAANEKGVQALHQMADDFGLDVVHAYMGHVQDNAEESVRRVIDVLKDGSFRCELDNGAVINVAISINREQRTARIDFTGTAPQQDNNFNAPTAVCKAAVLYVFRCLVDDDIPLNAGCLKPLEIIIPENSMLNPVSPAAVVAGNVETSTAITNTLFGALGAMASAQNTMNNITFGNDRWQYYETVSGGSGAGPNFDGTSVVQTHMTNSRLTDPEVLEWRFPVVLESYALRRGTGGRGRHRGGDGGERRIRFLEPMTVSFLSGNRRVPPFGLNGGADGALGHNRIERADGHTEEFPGAAKAQVAPGDVVVIETPSGGGYGHPEEPAS